MKGLKSAAFLCGYLCLMVVAVTCGSCLLVGCNLDNDGCPCIDCDCDQCGPDCPCVDCPCLGGNCADGQCVPANKYDFGITEDEARNAKPTCLHGGEVECPQLAPPKEREGVYLCMKCRKGKVGAEWHTIYVDGGGAATFMCEHCWSTSTIPERERVMTEYFDLLKVKPQARKLFYQAFRAACGST